MSKKATTPSSDHHHQAFDQQRTQQLQYEMMASGDALRTGPSQNQSPANSPHEKVLKHCLSTVLISQFPLSISQRLRESCCL